MNYSNPSNLGVLACPGGEVFADEVISHLKKGYRRSFDNLIAELANAIVWKTKQSSGA